MLSTLPHESSTNFRMAENMMTMYINTWEKMLKYVDATKYNNNILRGFKFQMGLQFSSNQGITVYQNNFWEWVLAPPQGILG